MDNFKITNYKEYKYLFKVVASVVNNCTAPTPPEDINYDVLYKISVVNKLDSFLVYSINKNNKSLLPIDFQENCYVSMSKSLNRAKKIDNTLNMIVGLFEENKINNIQLKGSYIKKYYPQIELRYMVDMDILISESDEKIASDLLKNNGFKLMKSGEVDDLYISPNNILLELHRKVVDETKKNSNYFSSLWDEKINAGEYKYSYYLEESMFYTFMVEHCLKHFFAGGFSARMLLDFYIFNSIIMNDNIKKEVENKLSKIELIGFAKELEEISNRWFSFDGEGLLETCEDAYVVNNGDMATVSNIVITQAIALEKSGVNITTSNYLFSKVFISKKNLQKYYNVLQVKPYLYPIFYCKYLGFRFKQIFSKTDRFNSFNDIKNIKNSSDEINNTKNLIKKFDIEQFIEYGG